MEGFFIYLIKSCGILALFWCCFKLFLQQETFFTFHRAFLISGIFMALLFPFWTLTELVTVEALPYTLMETSITSPTPMAAPVFNWWQVAGILYLMGTFFFLGRFALQLGSLRRLLKRGTTTVRNDGFTYIETQEDTSPFSFFHIIVYNPRLHTTAELETILAHEKVHALQKHSLDILLIHLFSAFQWINPFIWWYKTTVSQNLEYIADQEVIKNMGSCREYQYLLLRNSAASMPHSSIINPIFNSSIKKRIVMLNKNRSHQFKAWKFSLVIPFLTFFLVAFNTNTVTQAKPRAETQNPGTDNGDPHANNIVYTVDKTTTAETLQLIVASLKKECNMDLLFKDITRNTEGFITNINSSFTVNGGSGTATSSDVEGIKPFNINVIRDNGGNLISVGFQMNPTEQNNVPATEINKFIEVEPGSLGNPVYIIDGVEYKPGGEPELNPEDIHSIDVIRKTEAIKQYGEKGKNGVINVVTIKKSDFKGPNEILQVLSSKDNSSIDTDTKEKTRKMITITGYKSSDTINSTDPNTLEKTPKTITITGYKSSDPDTKPLIILDGIEKESGFNISNISADTIENIQVYKDGEATQLYGKKGADGVIDITTKKSGWTLGYGRNVTDPDELYNIDLFKQNGLEKAIIFVNGVNKGKNYMPTMKYSEVESIGTYLPGKSTTDKFGRQGKNGVIEITTKKD